MNSLLVLAALVGVAYGASPYYYTYKTETVYEKAPTTYSGDLSFTNGLTKEGGSSASKAKLTLVYTIEAKNRGDYLKVWDGILKTIKKYYINPEWTVVTVYVYGNSIQKHTFTSFADILKFIQTSVFTDFGARFSFDQVALFIARGLSDITSLGKKTLMTIIGGTSLKIKDHGRFSNLMKLFKSKGFQFSLIGVKGLFDLNPFFEFIAKGLCVTVDGVADIAGGILKGAGALIGGVLGLAGNIVGGVLNGAGQIVGGVVNGAANVVGGAVNAVGSVVGGVANGIGNILGGLFG